MALFAFIFCGFSFLDYFYASKNQLFFPAYSWELGFGQIFSEDKVTKIEVTRINDKVFDPPVEYKDLFPSSWVPTADYKIVKQFARELKKLNGKSRFPGRSVLEHELFRKKGLQYVQYQVRETYIDPLDFYRKKEIIRETIHGGFEFEK